MEFVFVVERSRLFDLGYPQGFRTVVEQREEVQNYLARIREHGFFVERRKAELDCSLKQIIPYVVLHRGDEVLLLQRKNAQGEKRLHGKRSIGIGGHINPVDDATGDVLVQGLARELEEELHVDGPLTLHAAGCLNDDATPVGSVHFGLVVVARCDGAEVRIREVDMMDGRFAPIDELRALHREAPDRFETWSAFLVADLDAVLAADVGLEQALRAPA